VVFLDLTMANRLVGKHESVIRRGKAGRSGELQIYIYSIGPRCTFDTLSLFDHNQKNSIAPKPRSREEEKSNPIS
jgi:hypothetical protein